MMMIKMNKAYRCKLITPENIIKGFECILRFSFSSYFSNIELCLVVRFGMFDRKIEEHDRSMILFFYYRHWLVLSSVQMTKEVDFS